MTEHSTPSTHPLLVDANWLNEHLNDDQLRILDVTTFLDIPEDGPAAITAGLEPYQREHIPGAAFADLVHELSDQDAALPFTVLDSATFAEHIGALGVSNEHHVVIYDQGAMMWATRLWWNLRLEGFDRVSVLDGGLPAWQQAGYPTASGTDTYPPTNFVAHRRPELLADLAQVLAAIEGTDPGVVNLLDPDTYSGVTKTYDRPGHIAGSSNVFAGSLMNADGTLATPDTIRNRFRGTGALRTKQPITYCGGGIAATVGAFQLARVGREDVAVYDGSMNEWASDPSLPMETGSH